MRRLARAVLVLLTLAGCTTVPHQGELPVSFAATAPEAILEKHRAMVPDRFQALGSVVFEFVFQSLSGIGYVDIDAAAGAYKVVVMNQLGVKFFEVQGNRDGVISQYTIEPLARQGNVAAGVGDDIMKIYMDLVPGPGAAFIRKKNSVVFREQSGEGALEYEFSGGGPHLSGKTYREDNRAVWRVFYEQHDLKNGKLFPMVIVFSHYRHGYRLIVRQKEIRS